MLDLLVGGRKLVFESPLSLEDATRRLQQEITPSGVRAEWRRPLEYRVFEKRPQSFIGTFADGRFHMVRLVRGRGSIRPWIDGQLARAVNGCRVDVRLKLPTLAFISCVPFLLFAMLALYAGGVLALWGVFVIVAPVIMWNMEAQKAERLLADLFQSQPSRMAV
jgi:hypothetical protein